MSYEFLGHTMVDGKLRGTEIEAGVDQSTMIQSLMELSS